MLHVKPQHVASADARRQNVSVCGKAFVADASGALYWPAERALIVSDLHFEKGSAFARGGQLLPPYDTRETLQRLAEVIERYGARTLIALGDSFHDAGGWRRMSGPDRDALAVLQDEVEWIWITGNHDRELAAGGADRPGGYVLSEIQVEGITLRHEPRNLFATHEIAGHLHPAAKICRDGFSLRRPCFIGNGLRLVLPAFGSYAGGLNVLDEAFAPLFGREPFAVWMMGHEGLYPIATRLLRGD